MTHANSPVSEKANLIIESKPNAWEFLLLGQVVIDQMQTLRSRLLEGSTDAKIAGPSRPFHIYSGRSLLYFTGWLADKLAEFAKLTASHKFLFDPKNAAEIFGQRGRSGDSEEIISLGIRIVAVLWKLNQFAHSLRRFSQTYSSAELANLFKPDVHAVWTMMLEHVDAEVESFAAYCETIGPKLLQHVNASLNSTESGGQATLTLTYKLRQPDSILQLIAKLQRQAALVPKPTGDFSMRSAELLNDRDELRQELQNALTHLVFAHGPTLLRKKRQMVASDDYGNKSYDKFEGELDYFVKNVFCRDIPSSVWNYLWDRPIVQSPISVLGELLNKFEAMSASHGQMEDSFSASMSAYEYEHFCSELLKKSGWITKVTAASGDQGIDIIAAAGSIKLVVQCKLYSTPVGNAAVQQVLAGQAFEQADFAAVATNSSFTQSAKSLAAVANVILLHHDELPDLHNKLGLVLHSGDVENSVAGDSADHLAVYLESLNCRPIDEIVQKAKQDLGEINDLSVPKGLVDPLFERSAKAPAKPGAFKPSPALAAVIGDGLMARTEVVTKLWDYIKANKLQDAYNKRAINSDAKLLKVFGKPQVSMFEMADLIGKHLS